jgi:hypothetical protein
MVVIVLKRLKKASLSDIAAPNKSYFNNDFIK